MKENYELIGNEKHHQYEFHIGRCVLGIGCIKNRDGVIYLTHAEVPMELGGKGIGSQLVEKVLSDIEKKDLRLVLLCPLVVGYIQEHPDWERIIMSGIYV